MASADSLQVMLEPGPTATMEDEVRAERTAEALGSGDVPVYATPALLALVERAAVAAVAGFLEPATTSVGVRAEVEHEAPTPVGGRVTATATLEAVEGRRLRFSFVATDAAGRVARGTHERVIVDRDRFVDGAARRR